MSDYVALFTGQGSQFAGMGRELSSSHPAAAATLEDAERALPGIEQLCFRGSPEELQLTVNTQPCVLAVDLAAYRAYGRQPVAAAGHSLGEYAALVAAQCLDLQTAVRLVRARAEAMQNAVPAGVGGMVALRMPLAEARKAAGEVTAGVCDLANINSPEQIVVAGHMEAMRQLVERFGRRRAMLLSVSVPFHSTLLAEAGEEFGQRIDDLELRDPSFPIVCNVDARPVTTAAEVRDALKRQFASSVQWQASIEFLLDRGRTDFIEFGPKPTLVRMVQQIAKARGVEVRARAVCGPDDLPG